MSLGVRSPHSVSRRPSPNELDRSISSSTQGSQFFNNAQRFSMNNVTFNVNGGAKGESDDAGRINQWLGATEPQVFQPGILSKRTAGTGMWFVHGKLYQRWLRSDPGHALWITGMPGAGKTMLTSIAIDDLQDMCANSAEPQAVVFYMCQYKTQPSTSNIIGSLLRQLYDTGHPDVCRLVEMVFDQRPSPSSRLGDSEDGLVELLRQVLGFYHNVHIVIDALDELRKDTQDKLLRMLWPLTKAKLLLSSRLNVTSGPIGRGQAHRPVIWAPIAEQNLSDIERFVRTSLRSSGRMMDILEDTQVTMEGIVAKITQKASGMFLLAALQVEALKSCITRRDLLSKIDKLPSGEEALYRLTMDRLEGQAEAEVSVAKRALLWVTYAQDYLAMEDLRTALAYVSPESGIDAYDRPPESVILSCCCGLLVVDESPRVVRLVHLTADNFIRGLPEPLFKSPHSFIARYCIAYLSSCSPLEPSPTSLSKQDVQFPYAFERWAMHGKEALTEPHQPQDVGVKMAKVVSAFILGCRDYVCRMTPASGWQSGPAAFEVIQPVHLAALYGFPHVLERIGESLWDERTSSGSAPIHLAAYRGHEDIVEVLLRSNPHSVNDVDDFGFTPLMLACQQGHNHIVEQLLSAENSEVDINKRSKDHDATALILATRMRHTAVVETVISHRKTANVIDLNAQDNQGCTALMIACANGYEDIVQAFVTNTSSNAQTLDINQGTAFGFTAFTEAALYGSVRMFGLLLSHPQQAFDPVRDTALFRAVKFGREEMVRYLLTMESINVNVRASAGATPLIAAAQDGRELMFRLLLEQPSIDVNRQDNKGYTALMYVAEAGLDQLVALLLRRSDLQVNMVSTKGRRTALMLACMRGHEGAVQLLLEHRDIDIQAVDERKLTALKFALGEGEGRLMSRGIVSLILKMPATRGFAYRRD